MTKYEKLLVIEGKAIALDRFTDMELSGVSFKDALNIVLKEFMEEMEKNKGDKDLR